jgi:hypothetical protein
MNKAHKVYIALVVGIAGCSQPPPDTGSQSVVVALPIGDAQAGRRAFLDLKCIACHGVPADPDLPATISANPGPLIDERVAGRDVSYLITAIASPSHELSPNLDDRVRAQLAGVLSPMGDFSHTITVRQLVDLQAYIRTVK